MSASLITFLPSRAWPLPSYVKNNLLANSFLPLWQIVCFITLRRRFINKTKLEWLYLSVYSLILSFERSNGYWSFPACTLRCRFQTSYTQTDPSVWLKHGWFDGDLCAGACVCFRYCIITQFGLIFEKGSVRLGRPNTGGGRRWHRKNARFNLCSSSSPADGRFDTEHQ